MAEPIGGQAQLLPAEEQDIERRYALERTRMTLEAGWLGKFFGSATNAPTNIAGLILVIFTVASIIVLFVPSPMFELAKMPVIDYLKLVLPVITLVLGYLFGKST